MTERKSVENEIKQIKKHLCYFSLDKEEKAWYEMQLERLEKKLLTLPKNTNRLRPKERKYF